MDAETHRKVDELIAAQINALHAEMCKPENPPATYGRFRAFLYRADRRHERLMMQTRWYPLVIGAGLVGAVMAGTAAVITYFVKGAFPATRHLRTTLSLRCAVSAAPYRGNGIVGTDLSSPPLTPSPQPAPSWTSCWSAPSAKGGWPNEVRPAVPPRVLLDRGALVSPQPPLVHQSGALRDPLDCTARRQDPVSTSLTIASTSIRQDEHGRFCLNDLHVASGGEKRHQVSDWRRQAQTAELVEEISNSGLSRNKPVEARPGRYGGTYAVKELVYAYAMWVSPKFHLAVIRAYDQMVTQGRMQPTPAAPTPAELSRLEILQLAMDSEQKRIEAEAKLAVAAPKVEVR